MRTNRIFAVVMAVMIVASFGVNASENSTQEVENKETDVEEKIDPETEEKIEEKSAEIHILLNRNDIRKARMKAERLIELAPEDERVMDIDSKVEAEEKKLHSIYEKTKNLLKSARKAYWARDYREAEENINLIFEYEDDQNIKRQLELQDYKEKKEVIDEDPEELYESASGDIQNYEMEEARGKIEKILAYRGTPDLVRYKSYFMKAFIHNFNDDITAAVETFVDLIETGLDKKYGIIELPEYLARDSELLKAFNDVREQYEEEIKISYESIVDMMKKARKLSENIREINSTRINARRSFINAVFESAKTFYKGNNFLKAAQDADIVIQHNPSNQVARYIYESSLEKVSDFVSHAGEREKSIFKRAVELFVEGRYNSALRRFRSLRDIAPEIFDVFIAQSQVHQMSGEDIRRAKRLVREAERDLDDKSYDKAREKVLMAINLNKYNMEAVILLEEIRHLRSSRTDI